jgi:2-dehydropantoate 2-reductase
MTHALGKVGLIGPGAIGGFYGGMLALAGEDVNFLFRSTYDAVVEHGLTLVHHADACKQTKVSPLHAYDHAKSIGVCDWVIVAAKATANDRLAEMMSPMVGPSTRLLTLQNGMGNVENLLHLFGKDRTVVGALCFTCINRTGDGVIESLLPGYVQFGQLGQKLSPEAQTVVHAFSNAGIKVRTSDSLDEALWRKLCWNVPFNGLSIAAGGITTDLILADPELKNRAYALMLEVQASALAHGVEIEDAFLNRQFELTEPMGPYKPSSLIDYMDGKPVEVDAIWGEPLRRAQSKRVEVPEMDRIYRELNRIMKGQLNLAR